MVRGVPFVALIGISVGMGALLALKTTAVRRFYCSDP